MPGLMGKAKPAATVSARVLDSDGNVIADLGTIAGGNPTKAQAKSLAAKLRGLKERREREEMKHGG